MKLVSIDSIFNLKLYNMELNTLEGLIVTSKNLLNGYIIANGGYENINIATLRKAVDNMSANPHYNNPKDHKMIFSNYLFIISKIANIINEDITEYLKSKLV
ncbi:MAG: hypothetical protein [Bacteriophage sp.]|nr:MAG: hypothetical protein [Bacteriophage sp.]